MLAWSPGPQPSSAAGSGDEKVEDVGLFHEATRTAAQCLLKIRPVYSRLQVSDPFAFALHDILSLSEPFPVMPYLTQDVILPCGRIFFSHCTAVFMHTTAAIDPVPYGPV